MQRISQKPHSVVARTQALQAALVHGAPELMFVLDAGGAVEFANRADLPPEVAQLLEASASTQRSKEGDILLDAIARIATTGQAETLEVCVNAGTEKERWYGASLKRAEGLGSAPSVLLFLNDVTERQRATRELQATVLELAESKRQMLQAQKMESIGRLAGGVAHDFNNLLTAIISFSRFVMDDLAPGDPRRSDLAEVLKAADSAAKLTSQLLAFSRKRPVEPVLLELNGAVLGICRVLQRTLAASMELCFVEAAQPVHVTFDAGQLDQLVMNLAVNARDAMRDGGTLTMHVDVRRISNHRELASGDYAALTVSDTGTGMSEEVMAQIFEPFFTTKGEKGTGLGLATCYGIAKQANGHIEASSKPGHGSKFTVLLPLAPAPSKAPAAMRASLAPQSVPKQQLHGLVVIVEDQPSIRRIMQRNLENTGLNVVSAGTAEEALTLVEELDARVDLLVTDVVLPGMSGVKLADALRQRLPDLRVLLCSGFMGNDQDPGITIDARTEFLPKPFTGEDLARKATALFA